MAPLVYQEMTDQELSDKYYRYCGYWARHFLWKELAGDDLTSGTIQAAQAEADDLASMALLKLIKCPVKYRSEHNYVTRLIVNAVLDGIRIRRKIRAKEWQPPRVVGGYGNKHEGNHQQIEYFDSLPGPDGLAGKTQAKYDSMRAHDVVDNLPSAERIVVELHFGLTGLQPASERQISRKLGRSEFWVQRRLRAGLIHLREKLGVSVL